MTAEPVTVSMLDNSETGQFPLSVRAGCERAAELGITNPLVQLVVEHALLRHRRGETGEARLIWQATFGGHLHQWEQILAAAQEVGNTGIHHLPELKHARAELAKAERGVESALERTVASLLSQKINLRQIARLTGVSINRIRLIARRLDPGSTAT